MDEAKKTRLLLTAMIITATGSILLTAFVLLVLSIFWPVPLWKGLFIALLAGLLGVGATFMRASWGAV